MADRQAWTLALDTVREHIEALGDEQRPWMTAAQDAALHAVTAAGYPPLTWTERRVVMIVAIGEAKGSSREEIRERVSAAKAKRR